MNDTVKPKILFREFRNLRKFAKITGDKSLNGNLCTVLPVVQQAKTPKLMAPK